MFARCTTSRSSAGWGRAISPRSHSCSRLRHCRRSSRARRAPVARLVKVAARASLALSPARAAVACHRLCAISRKWSKLGRRVCRPPAVAIRGCRASGGPSASRAREIAEQGGGHVHMWVPSLGQSMMLSRRPSACGGAETCADAARAARHRQSAAMSVRPFRTGEDELAWLEVNNRAFRGSSEQGSWDLATITEREHSRVRPAAFLLHERDGRSRASAGRRSRAGERLMNEVSAPSREIS